MSVFPRKVRPGDHLVVDDRTGFTRWASQVVRETLTGFMVRRGRADPRHPQELLRTRADKQAVKNPRPPGVANYVGPLITTTTAAASAGAQTITVSTNARYLSGDRIRIQLSNGDFHRTVVTSLDGTTGVNFVAPLPESVASGAVVQNLSANAEVTHE